MIVTFPLFHFEYMNGVIFVIGNYKIIFLCNTMQNCLNKWKNYVISWNETKISQSLTLIFDHAFYHISVTINKCELPFPLNLSKTYNSLTLMRNVKQCHR